MFSENGENIDHQSSRLFALRQWLMTVFHQNDIKLSGLTGDAGFRRYYRFTLDNRSLIAVDAPPDKSNNQGFIALQQMLTRQAVPVPEVVAKDEEKGFFCLSDLGDMLLNDVINAKSMSQYYRQALELLSQIRSSSPLPSYPLPKFDEDFIRLELSIFTDWLLKQHLQIDLTLSEQKQLDQCFDVLVESALSQPQVVMHRDYHSRNIMVLADNHLGIIDFQDAVIGPVTYDAVSLLRDCYIRWPEETLAPLFRHYYEQAAHDTITDNISETQWQRWFDLMGLQRHIKASGIFARLYHRDGKAGYLKDIPLTLSYIADVSARYPELIFLSELVKGTVIPALVNTNRVTA